MTLLRRAPRVMLSVTISLAPIAGLSLLSGCATRATSYKLFSNSFLPQSPTVNMAEAAASLPKDVLDTPPDLYARELPSLTSSTQATLKLTELENRLKKAETRFSAGKKAYADGEFESARKEFNSAIDVLLEAPADGFGRERLERRLEEMVDAIYRYDISGLGAAESPDKFVFENSPRDSILDMTFPTDPRTVATGRKLQDLIASAQSQLPLDAHESVNSAIGYFSSERGKKILEHNLRRSGRYRSMIQRIFNEEGIPPEMIYVGVLESGFYPRAVSHASAVGMWQFMQPTGREYGLNQTAFADERMDPEKSTRASARYFRWLYQMFGDWNLALAAYNCGPGCVDRAIQRTGYADYWKLREMHVLPRDTDQYVPVILAFVIMAKNPSAYGLDSIAYDSPVEYDTIDITHNTHIELIAAACDKSAADLRDLNPALLKGVAPAGYQFRVPKGSLNTVVAALDSVPADKRASWKFHRVERGETVASIARKYSLSQTSLTAANTGMSEPETGDLLLVPASYVDTTPVVRTAARSRYVARPAAKPGVRPTATTGVRPVARPAAKATTTTARTQATAKVPVKRPVTTVRPPATRTAAKPVSNQRRA